MQTSLDADLIAAHAEGDVLRLVRLYGQAALQAEALGDVDEACFFWVYAYVFALEAGSDEAETYRAHLVRYGREM